MSLGDGGDGCQLPAELRNWFCECGLGVVGLAGETRSGGEAEGVCMELRGCCPPWALTLLASARSSSVLAAPRVRFKVWIKLLQKHSVLYHLAWRS